MSLNTDSSRDFPPAGNPNPDFAIRIQNNVALHEFGHALGLIHEHERSDAVPCDDNVHDGKDGIAGIFIGKFDPLSVMGYCRDRAALSLSQGDVAAVNYIYPRPLPQGDALPKDSYLLYLANARRCVTRVGNQILFDQCDNSKSETYRTIFNDDGTFLIQNSKSENCLDAAGTLEGSNIVETKCLATMGQRVYLLQAPNNTFRIQFANTGSCVNGSLIAASLQSSLVTGKCDKVEAAVNFVGNGN